MPAADRVVQIDTPPAPGPPVPAAMFSPGLADLAAGRPSDAGLAILHSAVTAAVTAAMSVTAQDQPPPVRQLQHPPGAYVDPYAAADDRPPRETRAAAESQAETQLPTTRKWQEDHPWAEMEHEDVRDSSASASAAAAVEPPPQQADDDRQRQWHHWRSSNKHGPMWHARKIARAASHAALVNQYAGAAVNQSRAMAQPIAQLPVCVRCGMNQPNIRCSYRMCRLCCGCPVHA